MSTLLHELRTSRGESLRAVATACGCTNPTILKAERGERVPHARVRNALERHYGYPWMVLLQPKDPVT